MSYGQLACYCTFGFMHQLEISVPNIMDHWKWTALIMALLAMTASAVAIQDVRTQQTSKSSKWYKATIAMLVISIVAVLGILYGFYHEQQQALANASRVPVEEIIGRRNVSRMRNLEG